MRDISRAVVIVTLILASVYLIPQTDFGKKMSDVVGFIFLLEALIIIWRERKR